MIDIKLALFTLVIGVIGGAVGSLLTSVLQQFVKSQERFEEDRDARVMQILSCLQELESDTTKYWSRSASDLGDEDTILASRILANVDDVNKRVGNLFGEAPSLREEVRKAWSQVYHSTMSEGHLQPNREANKQALVQSIVMIRRLKRVVSEKRTELPGVALSGRRRSWQG